MRCFQKLRDGDSLAIGYLGGSITFGVGATDPENTSWRARTTRWFRERFPDSTVTEINAALSGTGSDLAAFRVGDDLLPGKPDLVFVEFAVNDHRLSPARIVRAAEGLVRRIQRQAPRSEIVFILATMRSLAERYPVPPSVHAHRQVARHYGVPAIHVGEALVAAIAGAEETWESLTTDGCHPTDRGHAVYARTVRNFLEMHITRPKTPGVLLPKPLSPRPLEWGRLVPGGSVSPSRGWHLENEPVGRFLQGRLVSTKPGSEIHFHFQGTTIGLYWLVAEDSGSIEWSIDGSKPTYLECWDHYARRFPRPHYRILSDSLPPGRHLLRIRVSDDRPSESSGHCIRIGAFLLESPPESP